MNKIKGLTLEQINNIIKEKNKKIFFNQNKRKNQNQSRIYRIKNTEHNIEQKRLEINVHKKNETKQQTLEIQFKKEELDKNRSTILTTPDWFCIKSQKVDISIIVPLYKSSEVIEEQIKNWPESDFNLSIEIIYVDDKCPQESYKKVLDSWQKIPMYKFPNGIGKIILNDTNCGYARACNIGATEASGDYLIFLNADCVVSENWIDPMINILRQDKKVGIVGNMQTKEDYIDSAGSEWNWEHKSFLHIGKISFEGNRIDHAFSLDQIPKKLLCIEEREMVTGCCFAIPHNIFYDLGGFDKEFLIGYWEDADLCLRVRDSGYKILFQPQSKISHEVGHTKSGRHIYKNQNFIHFSNRWIDTGRIDNLVKAKRENPPICSIKNNINGKVVGCIIACNEEEFLEASADSISSMVDEWIIVVGGNEYAYKSGMCDSRGLPKDNTLDIAKKIVNKYGGIVIEPPGRVWKDKIEMRNCYAQKLNPGDWMFMLDGDEVYKPNQLWRITELMKDYECLILQFWTFWNKMNVIGTKVWDKYPQERIIKWKKDYRYADTHLFVSDSNGLVSKNVKTYKGSERLYYHYSWVRPLEKIIQKREYYKHQANKSYDNYIDEIFLKWREQPDVVSETHPFGGGGWEIFKGIHPEAIQKMINDGLLNF